MPFAENRLNVQAPSSPTIVMSTKRIRKKPPLNANQLEVLGHCAEGEPNKGCVGMSASGGRETTLLSLMRRGLIDNSYHLTDEGREAIDNSKP